MALLSIGYFAKNEKNENVKRGYSSYAWMDLYVKKMKQLYGTVQLYT